MQKNFTLKRIVCLLGSPLPGRRGWWAAPICPPAAVRKAACPRFCGQRCLPALQLYWRGRRPHRHRCGACQRGIPGRMGYRAEFTIIDWERKTQLLETGDIDCVWGSFTINGREDDYRWAGPYMASRQVVAVMPAAILKPLPTWRAAPWLCRAPPSGGTVSDRRLPARPAGPLLL